MPNRPEGFLPKGGNYRELISYRKAEIIYDFTFRFCEHFLKRGDRTIDQMVQAARSGKQNIAEGSKASVTCTETELKLTNVARASLEELLIDYQDFLRARDLPAWPKDSLEALYARRLGKAADESFETYRPFFEDPSVGRRMRQTELKLTNVARASLEEPPPRPWRISPSASSTRPTTSSTARSSGWKKTSSKKADSAYA